MTSIARLKQAYQGEWLAISIPDDGEARPEQGELVYHSADRDEVWRQITGDQRRIYVTYAGPLIEESHAVAF